MGQWYCTVNGRQYGPISEEHLRDWIAEHRVGPSDMVWTEGMAAWTPASFVPGLFGPRAPAPQPLAARTPVPAPGGTGGRTGACELISRAWAGMAGRWGIAIGFWMLLWLIEGGANAIPYVGLLVYLIVLAGPLTLGSCIFFLTYVRGGQVEIAMLLAGFKNWGTSVKTLLLTVLFTLGWVLLGALPGLVAGVLAGVLTHRPEVGLLAGLIPGVLGMVVMGIYASLRYSQAMYLLADNPALTATQAIEGSVGIMAGQKLRLFGLHVLFALASLACLLLICVGWVLFLVFGVPVMLAAQALFYDDLQPPRA